MRQLALARVSADVAKNFYKLQRSTEIKVSWALVFLSRNMVKMLHWFQLPQISRGLSRVSMGGIKFARSPHSKTSCLVAGLVVVLAGCTAPQTNQAPSPVSNVNNDEVARYAKALLAIETSRQAAVTEIGRVNDGNLPPSIICSQPESLKNLTRGVQAIAVNYCQQAKQAGETNGFSMSRFNAITANLPNDAELTKQVQAELARLQQTAPSPQTPVTSPSPVSPSPSPSL
jgi:hypothetical protein